MSDLQCAVTVLVVRVGARAPTRSFAASYDVDAELWDRLGEIADLHRGETVLATVDGELMREALATDEPVVELAYDSDGWVRRELT